MSSTYNTRMLIPEVMVKEEKFVVIRERLTYEEVIAKDVVPDWLT
jgi:diaminopimelate decarboxylase